MTFQLLNCFAGLAAEGAVVLFVAWLGLFLAEVFQGKFPEPPLNGLLQAALATVFVGYVIGWAASSPADLWQSWARSRSSSSTHSICRWWQDLEPPRYSHCPVFSICSRGIWIDSEQSISEVNMNAKRILFATDFSSYNDAALELASTLAAESGAMLYIVHVDEMTDLNAMLGEASLSLRANGRMPNSASDSRPARPGGADQCRRRLRTSLLDRLSDCRTPEVRRARERRFDRHGFARPHRVVAAAHGQRCGSRCPPGQLPGSNRETANGAGNGLEASPDMCDYIVPT